VWRWRCLRNYDPNESPDALPDHGPAAEIRQVLRRPPAANYGKVTGDRTMADIAEAPRRSLELPVHRRHVVQDLFNYDFPAHRAVHHSVRDAGGRDQLLRHNTGVGWRNIIGRCT